MKTLELTIDPKGRVQILAKGFSGSSCLDATRTLEEALGIPTADVRSAEFYLQSQTTHSDDVARTNSA